ncbi:MAG: biotin synthase BioB [Sedimentisphaerales bacterium]|nr:biotin synthase BioB [Sedimentisphaerales bacterium]
MAHTLLNGRAINHEDALYLLQLEGEDRFDLFYWANRIRLEFIGPEISLCAIASVHTGSCSEDCRFCAQSSHYNTNVTSQSLDAEQLLTAANQAGQAGADCFGLVSSGRRVTNADIEKLGPIIRKITESNSMRCCASLGCITGEQAGQLYAAGIRRYNHNLETSRNFFPQVVTTHTYDDRLTTVKAVKDSGMQSCCGGIIGLGESLQDRVDLALALRELDVDSVPLNFLNPIPGTPLADNEPLSPMTALQTIAMFRFVLPKKHIKVAGGREQCLRDLQSWMFYAGANSTMIGNYLTTTGRPAHQDHQMLKDLEITFKSQNIYTDPK